MAAIRLLCFEVKLMRVHVARSRGANALRWFVQLDLDVDIFIKTQKKDVLNVVVPR